MQRATRAATRNDSKRGCQESGSAIHATDEPEASTPPSKGPLRPPTRPVNGSGESDRSESLYMDWAGCRSDPRGAIHEHEGDRAAHGKLPDSTEFGKNVNINIKTSQTEL